MELIDFSHGFDVLVNSYSQPDDMGAGEGRDIRFNEHEKSVWLTKAQEEEVLSLYTGRNSHGDAFEQTEELRRYLANLIMDTWVDPIHSEGGTGDDTIISRMGGVFDSTFDFTFRKAVYDTIKGTGTESELAMLPSDLWFIIYESATVIGKGCGDGFMEVVPARHDELNKLKRNPFRGPNGRRVLRLDLGKKYVELISKYPVSKYYVRYLRRLHPIILEDMPDGLTIEGRSSATPCEVHESLHQRILERAVFMALQSKGVSIKEVSKA